MTVSSEVPSKADLLVAGAHPDDGELFCGGTIAKMVSRGRRVVIVDLTQGERGTRGSREERKAEALEAARILGVERVSLDCGDTILENNESNRLALIRVIRDLRPALIFNHDPHDRHPDHRKAFDLVRDAAFYSGIGGIKTEQKPYRPRRLFQFMGNVVGGSLTPDFVVDISGYFEKKLAALKAFKSQFFNPEYTGDETYIASERFWMTIEGRARMYGAMIDAEYGEPFLTDLPLPVDDIFNVMPNGSQV